MHASCPRDLYTSLPNLTAVSLIACAPSSQSSFFFSHSHTHIHHFSPPFDFVFLEASVSHSLQYSGTWWWRTKLLIISRIGKPLSLSKQDRKVPECSRVVKIQILSLLQFYSSSCQVSLSWEKSAHRALLSLTFLFQKGWDTETSTSVHWG